MPIIVQHKAACLAKPLSKDGPTAGQCCQHDRQVQGTSGKAHAPHNCLLVLAHKLQQAAQKRITHSWILATEASHVKLHQPPCRDVGQSDGCQPHGYSQHQPCYTEASRMQPDPATAKHLAAMNPPCEAKGQLLVMQRWVQERRCGLRKGPAHSAVVCHVLMPLEVLPPSKALSGDTHG